MLESLALKALAVIPSYASPAQCNSPNMVERLRCLINSIKLQLAKHRCTSNNSQTIQGNNSPPAQIWLGKECSWKKKKRCQYLSNRRLNPRRCYVGLFLGVRLIQFCLLSKATKKCTKRGFYRWRVINFNLRNKSQSLLTSVIVGINMKSARRCKNVNHGFLGLVLCAMKRPYVSLLVRK